MHIFQSIILGIVQGTTEFIPVSSSGHLVLVREFSGWKDSGLNFDIALHFGTLVAVIFYFRTLWRKLFTNIRLHKHLVWGIIIATIPSVIVGYFAEGLIIKYFRSGLAVGVWMIFVGLIFLLVEKLRQEAQKAKSKEVLAWWEYLLIGVVQSVSLIPGVSRSGVTIAAGMARKMSRREAAEFSFLLAVPAILGAVIYDLVIQHKTLGFDFFEVLIGFLVALVSGYFALRLLLGYLSRHRLNIFAYYLFLMGFVAIIVSIWK